MKLHAKEDDNEYLRNANMKSYWYENEKKEKACCFYKESTWSPALYSMFFC